MRLPWEKVPEGDSVEEFLRTHCGSVGSWAPLEPHGAFQCTQSISLRAPAAVCVCEEPTITFTQNEPINILWKYFCKIKNGKYWFMLSELKYLGCELSLCIFSCRKVLRKFFILDGKLSKTYTNTNLCTYLSHVFYNSFTNEVKDESILTVLAFFCRSTIWESRCVISSCCREASSVFLASSSAILEIWMLDCPVWGERVDLFLFCQNIELYTST